ncbi:MAG: type IV pilin protein [bacterium]
MNRFIKDRRGFTLVELMITVVIIGILAAVAVPIYQSQIKRAKASEADAALGTIRTALRVYYAENLKYPTFSKATAVTSIGVGIAADDLKGRYFSASDYTYTSSDGIKYTIQAKGSGNQKGINRQLDQDGNLKSF